MNRKQTLLIGAFVAATVLVTGTWYFLSTKKPMPTAAAGAADSERQPLYWTDPMVPGYKADKPGKSPFMDMQLVPVYAEGDDATTVSIRPEVVQNLGVRTYAVQRGKPVILIPREALIRTGSRNAVILSIGEGRFKPIDVIPGAESEELIEIRQGIKAGDVVVTSGQFLIDSEANVRASFQRMETPAGEAPK